VSYPLKCLQISIGIEINDLTGENKKANQVRIGSASIGKKQDFAVF